MKIHSLMAPTVTGERRGATSCTARALSTTSLMLLALGVVGALTTTPAAHAEAWSAQALYTQDGVEIGVDARVFALYSMLNALGFDGDESVGPAPLYRPQYSPARAKMRGNLGRRGQAMTAMDAVVQKNPLPARAYLDAVLELGPPPNFDAKGASPLAVALAAPLADWYNDEGGAAALRAVADEAKVTQKRLLPALDAAITSTTKLVRLGDAQDQLLDDSGALGRVIVVVNDLDRHNTLQRVSHGELTYIVTGPIDAAHDDAVINAATVVYGRTLVRREANKVGAGTLADVRSKLDDNAKAALPDDKASAAELLACAFAKKVRGPKALCEQSPLLGQPAADEALAAMAARVDGFAGASAVLSVAMADLLAPLAAPPAPPPVDEKKGKGKKGKGG